MYRAEAVHGILTQPYVPQGGKPWETYNDVLFSMLPWSKRITLNTENDLWKFGMLRYVGVKPNSIWIAHSPLENYAKLL